MTLQKGKKIDNKAEMLVKKTIHVEPLDSEDSSPKEKDEKSPREYILKATFPQRLVKVKKENSMSEIMEIFKQTRINILLDVIK